MFLAHCNDFYCALDPELARVPLANSTPTSYSCHTTRATPQDLRVFSILRPLTGTNAQGSRSSNAKERGISCSQPEEDMLSTLRDGGSGRLCESTHKHGKLPAFLASQ